MVTVGVNFVVSFCEQLIAILKLVAFTREVSRRGRQASGLAVPNKRLVGTDKLQVSWGVIGGVAQGKEMVPSDNEFVTMTF
jgi:hypothetical protein